MSNQSKVKHSLEEYNLAPSKRFGQNFLINENTSYKIIRSGNVLKDDTIIEVGVGLGALTIPLAKSAHQVIGIEIDRGIIRYHENEKSLPQNVKLVHNDILKADFETLHRQIGSKLKIMANLPYSISNPFLFKLIDNSHLIEWATIMLQKEVAGRLLAEPGSKQYGIPTVLLRSCASIEKLLNLQPSEFHPRPKVDSTVVKIIFSPVPSHVQELPKHNPKILQTLVRAAFGQRRKMLVNTLSSSRIFSPYFSEKSIVRQATLETIIESGIQPEVRGESLGLNEFVLLARSFEKKILSLRTNK